MQKRSFGSVEVYWLDREAVVRAVKRAARALARGHPEVRRIIMFGSMARGDAVPGSDVDLLLLLSHSDTPFLDRSVKYHPTGIPVGVDVFAYTEAEVARMLLEGNGFVKQAVAEGMVVYERKARGKAGAPPERGGQTL